MSLFELQAWLGHSSPSSTQHYARITPLTLTKAHTDAGYFARNVRAIEVLLDRDAITTGAVGAGNRSSTTTSGTATAPTASSSNARTGWRAARCDFYIPKLSSEAQLLEAKDGLQRMLVHVPLTDNERAAVEGDQDAVDRLLGDLIDAPTPAGRAPRQIGAIDDTASGEAKDGER